MSGDRNVMMKEAENFKT